MADFVLPSVFVLQNFTEIAVLETSNVLVLKSVTADTANISLDELLEFIDIDLNVPLAGSITFSGKYVNIFTDTEADYRETGPDPKVTTIKSIFLVPLGVYALTRNKQDLRNEIVLTYTFICAPAAAGEEGGPPATGNIELEVEQTVLNNYDPPLLRMLEVIAAEKKIPGEA